MALHEVQLKGYSVRPGNLSLGTFDSYGIEQLHVTADDSWDGLDILAVFHAPNGDAKKVVVGADGMLNVPPEATAKQAGNGKIVFVGLAENVQRITVDMGYSTKTHSDIEGDNPGVPTPDVVQQILQAALNAEKNSAEANTAAQGAQTAAESAASAAQASAESASKAAAEAASAKPYAESAKASAEAARNSENQAQQSSTEATAAKNAAQNAQAGAESSATAAAKSAKEAAASAVNLDSAANTATQKAVAASASAAAAKASESAAASSEAASRKYASSAEAADKTASEAAAAAAKAKTAAESAQADAAASKTVAVNSAIAAKTSEDASAKSAAAAKTSEDAAAKSAADADSTANSIKDSMTQIAANKEAVSQLKENTTALQKRQNVLVGSETGNPASCNDAFAAPLCGLTVYGKSTQDGTPGPDNPVPIVSAGDGGSMVVNVSDGNGKEQTLTLQTPTGLPGIPVTSGGNYTDQNGQQWICDEVDLERGVKVQRVNVVDLSTCTITGTTNLTATKRLAILLPLKARDYMVKALCNRLPYLVSFASDTIHFYVDTNNAQAFIPIDAKNPEEGEYILFYVLATPIETPLTPAEIAAYKALTAYAPDTVVQASDGAGIKLDYQRDVNLVVKNLEDAIASMTTT